MRFITAAPEAKIRGHSAKDPPIKNVIDFKNFVNSDSPVDIGLNDLECTAPEDNEENSSIMAVAKALCSLGYLNCM